MTNTAAVDKGQWLAIGELAQRAGVAVSALCFYESEGLIAGARSAGGRRRYPRHVLRRVAFIRAAQAVGLAEIRAALAGLPAGRTPTKADWQRAWPARGRRCWTSASPRCSACATGCIGCGCLSLKACALYNARDAIAVRGSGARYLAGDEPPA
jgi:MerR family redox-sensitive transcriptional activator SoxR